MTIFEKLGFTDIEFGEAQSVDEMTVLPVVGADRGEGISDPEEVIFQQTSEYGSMVFQNIGDAIGIGIIPSNTMIISDKKAQDHAMSDVGLVPAKQTISFNNAACIQAGQGGLLSGKQNQYNILPLELRKVLLNTDLRYQKEYSKLWDSIENFLGDIPDVSKSPDLELFFRPYEQQLNDFVAEFEPIDNQLGAVIFFNMQPVGIEIMPSNKHWEYYWRWILRGCYGAQLLKLRLTDKISPQKLDFKDDIASFINDFTSSLIKQVNQMLALSIIGQKDIGGFQKRFVLSGNTGGDIVVRNDEAVYASIV